MTSSLLLHQLGRASPSIRSGPSEMKSIHFCSTVSAQYQEYAHIQRAVTFGEGDNSEGEGDEENSRKIYMKYKWS